MTVFQISILLILMVHGSYIFEIADGLLRCPQTLSMISDRSFPDRLRFYSHYKLQQSRCNLITALQMTNKLADLSLTGSPLNVAPSNKLFTAPSVIVDFQSAWKKAISGDVNDLHTILSSTTNWENPLLSSKTDFLSGLAELSSFVLNASIVFYDVIPLSSTSYKLIYQFSFSYPMPWRPRIIIPGEVFVTLTNDGKSISAVKEKWDVSILDIAFKQFPPRFWDAWHAFSSPSPEYPPIKELDKISQDSSTVTLFEIPETMQCEVSWIGLAKYPGPPLLIAPGFSLFGKLKTSMPRKETYVTILPIEVNSGLFIDEVSDAQMKRSSWIYNVPTSLQDTVVKNFNLDKQSSVVPILYDDMTPDGVAAESVETAEENLAEESLKPDYVVGLENISVMKSIAKGVQRGANATFDDTLLSEFKENERKYYRYKVLPRRVIAGVDISGDATSEKISAAVKTIKNALSSSDVSRKLFSGKKFRIKLSNAWGNDGMREYTAAKQDSLTADHSNASALSDGAPVIGLQLWSVKGCFNPRAEPAMAIYEMQYDKRITRVFLELDFS